MDLARTLAGPGFYDCSSCDKNPALKVGLGHDGPPLQYWRENLVTGAPLMRCPLRTLQLEQERDAMTFGEWHRITTELFPPYREHGLLPRAGGIGDQDARTMDYLRALSAMDQRVESKFIEIRTAKEE